ncbi:hypothetical protein EDD21DRAFT_166643 [Dissophora ornata]|nr:hypothetical protein EDD21DRAFT_166643 [Dissophora ornata]
MDLSNGKDREAEAAELATYFARFSAALTQLEEELARWKNYETDYNALKTTLLDLPKETSHSVMVPIGNLAFMPGKLVHTNEVLVMLGDNWFVDRSAVQAAEIVDRRMEFVQENITKLQAQEEQIRTKSGMAPGLLGGQEYNEEGLPIVEITEPYFSDDEDDKDAKSALPGLLPFSQKTPKEQAEDRAILERIAELEREDEERERRREAGEIVTSDEETESDDEPIEFDDGESEDEFRPKALDSDEEYEEEVWEHSGNEDEDEENEIGQDVAASPQKSVRFADQVAKAMKSKPTTKAKPKSPSDLINQMRAKRQDIQSASTSDKLVTMENLESTFSKMATGVSSGAVETPVSEVAQKPESPAPLKSALKPPPKKTSLFKQLRAQSEVQELVKGTPLKETPVKKTPVILEVAPQATEDLPATPPKKMSKFAKDRAAASAAGPSTSTAASTKPALGGVSERVFERHVVAPQTPASRATPGVSEVVERDAAAPILPSKRTTAGLSEVVERNVVAPHVQESPAAVPSIVGVKDVIENTFTKSPIPDKDEEAPSSGRRKKPSLFRQHQQQQQQSSAYMEPEPAIPDAAFQGDMVEEDDVIIDRPTRAIPQVLSSRSVSKSPAVEKTQPAAIKDKQCFDERSRS